MRSVGAVALVIAGIATPAYAVDWEDLAKDGWAVYQNTSVRGEFKGCEFGKRIPLMNGMVFVCQTYFYEYSYGATVYILTNVRAPGVKVVIDDEVADGQLYGPPAPKAH